MIFIIIHREGNQWKIRYPVAFCHLVPFLRSQNRYTYLMFLSELLNLKQSWEPPIYPIQHPRPSVALNTDPSMYYPFTHLCDYISTCSQYNYVTPGCLYCFDNHSRRFSCRDPLLRDGFVTWRLCYGSVQQYQRKSKSGAEIQTWDTSWNCKI